MNNWLSKSIANKVMAAFIGVFIITYMLTAFVVYGVAKQSITQIETNSLTHFTNLKLDRIGYEFDELGINLQAWANLEVMNDLISGDIDKRVARTLEGLKRQYKLNGEIYAFDMNGKLVAASSLQPDAYIAMPAEWLPINDFKIVGKHPNQLASAPMIAFVAPIRASFSPDFRVGYIALTYPWLEVEKMAFDAEHKTVLLQNGGNPLVLASDLTGNVDARLLGSDIRSLKLNDLTYIAGRSSTLNPSIPDWQIVALKDEKAALKSLTMVGIELFVLGLLLSIPIVFLIRWLSKKLTDSIHELTDFVAGITSSGDLSKRVNSHSQDELGTLADAFNLMTENLDHITIDRERFVLKLEDLNRTLEQKVQERTRATEAANAYLTKTIQELRDTQGKLVHSEKMASLGQLVAGVAHELNNPVGYIYANFPHLEEYVYDLLTLIDLLLKLPMDESCRKQAEQQIKGIDLDFLRNDILKIIRSGKSGAFRIKEIVSSLRSFSRLDEAELKSVLLEDGITDTLALLSHQTKNRVKVVTDFRLNQPVACFAGQVNQVFMNIIHNAILSISDEGTISIATRKEGEWAIVNIEDSGHGIPQDEISRVFDPFFTTKKIGEGTGLGLSISYGIIEKHGGRIEVESEVGKGTRFTIRLRLVTHIEQLTEDRLPWCPIPTEESSMKTEHV